MDHLHPGMKSSRQRILFVVPPVRLNRHEYEYLVHWPRHALALAAELEDDYELSILDITAEFHRAASWGDRSFRDVMATLIQERVAEFVPTVVAVHAHAAPHVPIVVECLNILQHCAGAFIVVVGGMAASHLPGVLAPHLPDGGWLVRGEVSGRASEVFAVVAGNEAVPPAYTDELQDRRRHVLTLVAPAADVDYRLPPFHLLPMGVYEDLFRNRDFVPHIETSLGCSYRCTFCGVHYPLARGGYRRRTLDRVMEELRYLRDQHGFDEFYFCDETFTLDRDHAASLCKAMIDEAPGIRWRCVTRVDAIDAELVALMAHAGCFEIGFGIEAGSESTLKRVAKATTTDRAVDAIQLVQEHGIAANALLILGLPHEDHSDIRRTFEYIATVARPRLCQIFTFHPVPGTVYFEQPGRFGLTLPSADALEMWYLFDHIGEPVSDTRYLSRADIARYYLLFNEAFATIANPEANVELIDRVLHNRFPVRRKGVTWIRDGGRLKIYRLRDPAASITQNTLAVEPEVSDRDERRVEALSLLLDLADGTRTESEIGKLVRSALDLDHAIAAALTNEYFVLLEKAGIIAYF